jgi:hypothetical protein
MTQAPLGAGLEEVRSFQQLFVLELLASAVVLAGLVNLFSGALHTYLTAQPAEAAATWWWVELYGGLLVLALLVIGVVLWRQRVVEVTGFTLMLPVQVSPDKPRAAIISHAAYQPALYGHQFFGRPGQDFRACFKDAWPDANPLAAKDFRPGHYCWDALMNLAQALVVQLFKFYGEHSLTPSAYFKPEFRRLAGHLKTFALARQNWPPGLQNNPFLTSQPNLDIKSILLPQKSSLKEEHPPPLPKECPGRRNLILATCYASLAISFSPNWSVLSASGQLRALEEFPDADADSTCFLLMPIELRLTVKRFYISGEQMRYHYWWLQKLMDNLRRRMSWGYYVRGGRISDDNF